MWPRSEDRGNTVAHDGLRPSRRDASMWPRSEDRGNFAYRNGNGIPSNMLQCGLGPKTEEIRGLMVWPFLSPALQCGLGPKTEEMP